MQIKKTKLPKSELEIEGELDADTFEGYFNKALKKIGEKVEMDGFRKGKVPENVLLAKIPEMQILEEMAELALGEVYPKILEEEKIDAIGRPEISILKLARKNPLVFKIKTTILPEMKLSDYKKTASEILKSNLQNAKKSDFDVSEKELEDTIMDIRKSRAPKINIAEGAEKEIKETELPEFNDAFVKGLGPFENIEDFKNKLRENIKLEKENQLKEKTRIKIVEKIIADTEMEVPEMLIEVEVNKIIYKMESDITAMGLKFEDYLKHLNKTVEDLKKEFRLDGEKKAKLALILNKIAETEKIIADPEQVANEVAHILEHYKEADPERARMHAENVLTNEKVFAFLESL